MELRDVSLIPLEAVRYVRRFSETYPIAFSSWLPSTPNGSKSSTTL